MLGYFFFLSSAFSRLKSECQTVGSRSHQDRHFVGPDLGPDCLQSLSADNKVSISRKRRVNSCQLLKFVILDFIDKLNVADTKEYISILKRTTFYLTSFQHFILFLVLS